MTIIVGGTKKKIEDMKIGAVFMYDGETYMLIEGHVHGQAVNLKNGSTALFSPPCEVEERSATLYLDVPREE